MFVFEDLTFDELIFSIIYFKCYGNLLTSDKWMYLGVWGVGLATRNTDLNVAPGGRDAESWVLCHDSVQRHNNIEIERVSNNPVEGDILVGSKAI